MTTEPAKASHADMPYGHAYKHARRAKIVFIVTLLLCGLSTAEGLRNLTYAAAALAVLSCLVWLVTHRNLYKAYYAHWHTQGEGHHDIIARWKKDFPNHLGD